MAPAPSQSSVTDLEALPPDLPLPASPRSKQDWLGEANVLQPYGHSAFTALTDFKGRPERLKKEFGFNAITVQPPDSHNTIAAPADKLTEKQFNDSLAAYRAAGYHILLYTSVMANGLSPEFQSGQIGREHPDWLQRDPKGNHVLEWNVPWLCPSSGARELALERSLRIARQYKADGILLDNQEFYFAAAGWTCHCDRCTKAFREYLQRRFGAERTKELFGAAPETIEIPSQEAPLYFEWLHWRNRVWADVNESFRAELRKINPNIMLFANTQYLFENGMLATDSQYTREDIVVSESCNLNSRQMSAKLFLGHALAERRPLWNYIGTFAKADDYTGLLPPETIGPSIAATLAHGALPWIVDGFDDGPTNPKSRELMSTLLAWHATHGKLFASEPYSAVAAIISPESRNVMHRSLIPPHVAALQSAGASPIGLRDDALMLVQLRRFKVITIENACCLPPDSANVLATWVREGGTLVAAADSGSFDEIGRKRKTTPLWQALDLKTAPPTQVTVGHGAAISPEPKDFAATAVRLSQSYSFLASNTTGAEVIAYRMPAPLILHIIRHEKIGEPITLNLHRLLPTPKETRIWVPGSDRPQSIRITKGPDGDTLTIPNAPLYCVVEIPLE